MADASFAELQTAGTPRLGTRTKVAVLGSAYAILFATSQGWLVILIGFLFGTGLLVKVTRWRQILPTLAMAVASGTAICSIHLWSGTFETGIWAALRLNISIWGALLFAATTSSSEILDALEDLVLKAGKYGERFRLVPLQAAMVTRFVPVFADHVNAMCEARVARGARKWSMGLAAPLVISALRQSDQLAEAIQARGFDPCGFQQRESEE